MASISAELIRSAVRLTDSFGSVAGTGFGYARPDCYHSNDPGVHTPDREEQWRLWFVTCAHVIDMIEANQLGDQHSVRVELNEVGVRGGRVAIDYPASSWIRHEGWAERCSRLGPFANRNYTSEDASVDVAVATAPVHMQRFDELDWWGFSPKVHMTKAMLTASDDPHDRPLQEGDAIFMLGFPAGYYVDAKNWPVVRQGVLAQMQPYLAGTARTFLIDGSVFGGNSGGPVVSIPQPLAVTGTQQFTRNALLGMVSGHHRNPGVGENADLGIVVPLDTINRTIEMALATIHSSEEEEIRITDVP